MTPDDETSKTSAKTEKQIRRPDEGKQKTELASALSYQGGEHREKKRGRGDTQMWLFLLDWWVLLTFIYI